MADRPDNSSSPPRHSHPPPPSDPFARYQTPWPRPEKEEQNPFIQFRRFADEQFQSFFSSFPDLFATVASPRSFQREVDQMLKRRDEFEEGLRKQIEQSVEESRQAFQQLSLQNERHNKKLPEQEKDVGDAHPTPWWETGRAARCPALNEKRTQNASRCPAMYDKQGQPKTELDMYDQLKSPASYTPMDTSRRGWLSSVGWDGKRRQTVEGNADLPQEHNSKPASDRGPLTITSMSSRRLEPFDNPHDTIPWLLSNRYSPVFLCNPNQRYVAEVAMEQGVNHPFKIRYTLCRRPGLIEFDDHREQLAKQKPWADAFEDLVSLQQTGKMVERDYSTYRTPKTWIHDMVARGSLGPTWGFNQHGQLTKLIERTTRQHWAMFQNLPPESVSPDDWPPVDTKAQIRLAIVNYVNDMRRALTSATHSDQTSADEISKELNDNVDEVTRVLAEMLPELDVARILNAFRSKESSTLDEKRIERENSSTGLKEDNSSWSSSSTTWASTDPEAEKTDSILSTTTTTERWTRPDGTIETKRVFKKRFADGREVEEESHQYEQPQQPAEANLAELPRHQDLSLQDAPWPVGPKEETGSGKAVSNKQRQTSTPVQDELKKRKGGGWFWN